MADINRRYERHELSAAFPDMNREAKQSFLKDINKHGLREAIWLYEGKVLDGWHRYLACLRAGVKPRFRNYEGDDPAGFVLSKNIERRHLTAMERAEAVAWIRNWRSGPGQPEKELDQVDQYSDRGADRQRTTAELADEAGVGKSTMKRAKRRIREKRGEAPPRAPAKPPARPPAKPPAKPPAMNSNIPPGMNDMPPVPPEDEPPGPSPAGRAPASNRRPPPPPPPRQTGLSDTPALTEENERLREENETLKGSNLQLVKQMANPQDRRLAERLSNVMAELGLEKKRKMDWQMKATDWQNKYRAAMADNRKLRKMLDKR